MIKCMWCYLYLSYKRESGYRKDISIFRLASCCKITSIKNILLRVQKHILFGMHKKNGTPSIILEILQEYLYESPGKVRGIKLFKKCGLVKAWCYRDF